MSKDAVLDKIALHEKAMNACLSKAYIQRENGRFDLSDRLEEEADNHRNMMAHYKSLLSKLDS